MASFFFWDSVREGLTEILVSGIGIVAHFILLWLFFVAIPRRLK